MFSTFISNMELVATLTVLALITCTLAKIKLQNATCGKPNNISAAGITLLIGMENNLNVAAKTNKALLAATAECINVVVSEAILCGDLTHLVANANAVLAKLKINLTGDIVAEALAARSKLFTQFAKNSHLSVLQAKKIVVYLTNNILAAKAIAIEEYFNNVVRAVAGIVSSRCNSLVAAGLILNDFAPDNSKVWNTLYQTAVSVSVNTAVKIAANY